MVQQKSSTVPNPKRREGRFSKREACLFAASVWLCLLLLTVVGFDGFLERKFSWPLFFRARERLGRSALLDPHLKVFAFDDKSANAFQTPTPSLADWQDILRTIAQSRPRQIVIDQAFTYNIGVSQVSAVKFVEQMQRMAVPIIVKGAQSDAKVVDLGELADQLLAPHLVKIKPARDARFQADWLPAHSSRLYGPVGLIQAAFTKIGHDEDIEDGLVLPLLNLGLGRYLPHFCLLAGGESELVNGSLFVGGHSVSLSGGKVVVNLLSEKTVAGAMRSLADVKEDISAHRPTSQVGPGDTVLILPNLYVGGISRIETPLGLLPEPFVKLALANSSLSGIWLKILPGTLALTALWCILAILFYPLYERRGILLALAGIASTFIAGCTLVFAFGGVAISWPLPVLGFLATALLCRLGAARRAQHRSALLRHDLHGILSPDKLNSLARMNLQHLEATEQVVTIMFIDIVGFSRAAEKQTPKEAFSCLKSLIDQLRQTVHEFGGVVDRTMGDGMLCVFGYDLQNANQSPLTHAENAAHCAIEIQRSNLKRIMKAQKTREAVFPLRIGINTTGVYLGNLGDTERTDLTVIGNGVNFAQRLEVACDRHMAMLGASTRDILLDHPEIANALRKRYIRVKHVTDLVEAYELDPFYKESELLLKGDEAYRTFVGIERGGDRIPVLYPDLIRVTTNFGDGEMINFSLDGFTIKLSEYYAKDVTINLKMDTVDGYLGDRLEALGLASLLLEVRWARPSGDGFIHGCLIKNLNREQRTSVIELLRDMVKRHVAAQRRRA